MSSVCQLCRTSEFLPGNEILVPCRCPVKTNHWHLKCFGIRHRILKQPKRCPDCKFTYRFRDAWTPEEEAKIRTQAQRWIWIQITFWISLFSLFAWLVYFALVYSRWCPSEASIPHRMHDSEFFLSIETDTRYVIRWFFTGQRHEVTEEETLALLTLESANIPCDVWIPIRIVVQKPGTFLIYLLFLSWVVGFIAVVVAILLAILVGSRGSGPFWGGGGRGSSTGCPCVQPGPHANCCALLMWILFYLFFILVGWGILIGGGFYWYFCLQNSSQTRIQQEKDDLKQHPRVLDSMTEIRDTVNDAIGVNVLSEIVLDYHCE